MRIVCEVSQGCTFCATCLYECPVQAITMGPKGAIIDAAICTGCKRCMENCASEAIIERRIDDV